MHCPFLFPLPSLNGKGRTDDLIHSTMQHLLMRSTCTEQQPGQVFHVVATLLVKTDVQTIHSVLIKLHQLGRELVTQALCHKINSRIRIFTVSHLQCKFVVWSIKWALGSNIQRTAPGKELVCLFNSVIQEEWTEAVCEDFRTFKSTGFLFQTKSINAKML